MHSLSVAGKAPTGGGYRRNITELAQHWRRSTRAIGGFWLGSFRLQSERLTRHQLVNFYETSLGRIVREQAAGGLVTWEGYIQEMRLLLNEQEYMMSLRPQWWHNNVKVFYRSIVDGSRQTVTWSEDTGASDEYGEMQMLLSLPATTSAAATALQTLHLAEYAWPRSRMVGGLTFPRRREQQIDVLYVKCAGFWHTLNQLYQETSLTDTATNIITTVVGNSEFVTAGRIEANALSTYVEATPNPVRLGSALESITGQGDASGNLWHCGVYGGQKLVYEQAPQTVDYHLRGNVLCDRGGAPVLAPLLKPGFLVHNSNAPLGIHRPGGGDIWNDPRVAYVTQVEFVAPDGLRLRLYDEEETIAVLGEQIRRETAMPQPRR